MAASGDAIIQDPICGKEVDKLRARAVGIFGGVTYYFCSAECKAKFKDPRKVPRPESRAEPRVESRPEPRPESTDESRRAVAEGWSTALAEPKEKRDSAPIPVTNTVVGIEDELEAVKGGGRAWVVVLLLFAVAGVVLFFAFQR